jgi:hypothetical protein
MILLVLIPTFTSSSNFIILFHFTPCINPIGRIYDFFDLIIVVQTPDSVFELTKTVRLIISPFSYAGGVFNITLKIFKYTFCSFFEDLQIESALSIIWDYWSYKLALKKMDHEKY